MKLEAEVKSTIKTSVVIPVYNTGQYVEECIDSVFHQKQKEIEVIVIDDGSTDNSLEVLLRLQKKYPELIIVTQENHKQGYARNVGMKRAKGEYIYFLDSDDYILEDTLEKCYNCASKNKLDIVMFDAASFEDTDERKAIVPNYDDRHEIISERNEIFSGIYFLEKYYQSTYSPSPCLIYCSADFLKKNSIWFLPGVFFEDNEFYCKSMILAKRVMYIPQKFYQYRCRKSSTTQTEFDLKKAEDHIKVINAIADLKSLNEGECEAVVKQISLGLLRYVAGVCNSNALYDNKAGRLSRQLIETWMKICGNTIEGTTSLKDMNYLCGLCDFFPDWDLVDMKRTITDKRKQLLVQEFRRLPLSQRESKVAIYGCGKYTDKVLDFYEKWIGTIAADIIFLDSYIKKVGIKYRGYTVYPVSEAGERDVDYILISSPKYEEEMKGVIRKYYGDQFVIIMLYGDLHIII